MTKNTTTSHDPFAVLRIREFNFFLINRFFLTMGIQMQSVIVGWQIYAYSKDVLDLGLIGLTEAIPFILISLFSGHVADTFSRKKIIIISTIFFLFVTSFLFYCSYEDSNILKQFGTFPIFIAIAATGIIRGFLSAAYPSLIAQIVPRKLYANAATWNSTVWHIASIVGPSIAGFIIAINYTTAYSVDILFIVLAIFSFIFVSNHSIPKKAAQESIVESIRSGIKFVVKNQVILGALSLDLFAVLFGGAVALLPAFADKVLHAGAVELGFLRAAPAVGAVCMAFIIAYKPPTKNAGRNLFISVAAFGLATVLFGLSTSYFWALIFLFLTGAFDNVSVVIRHTILQLSTPDEMRGRVAAVNGIFIGSSNEIGAFESGSTARAFGLKPSIVLGGILTIAVVILTARLSPKLRKLNIEQLD